VADTDRLRPYEPRPSTQLGNDERYLANELRNISAAINAIRSVMQALEARMAAHGI
jgi:hypothetical protein